MTEQKRINALDSLRGGAMVLVAAYHLLYDLKFIFKVNLPSYLTPGSDEVEFVHTAFLWVLFAVSGICVRFSRDPIKRGAFLYIIGWIITLVSSILSPDFPIVFGVISFFGACMVITGFIKPILEKIPWGVLFAAALILWAVFSGFHKTGEIDLIFAKIFLPKIENARYLYPIGITEQGFSSADYFPLIPNIFMFLAGFALYRPIADRQLPDFFYNLKRGILSFIGKHSLIIYALHQPIILGILLIFLN